MGMILYKISLTLRNWNELGTCVEIRRVQLQFQVQTEVQWAAGNPRREELDTHEVRGSSLVQKRGWSCIA